jgi:hypothetical protein
MAIACFENINWCTTQFSNHHETHISISVLFFGDFFLDFNLKNMISTYTKQIFIEKGSNLPVFYDKCLAKFG